MLKIIKERVKMGTTTNETKAFDFKFSKGKIISDYIPTAIFFMFALFVLLACAFTVHGVNLYPPYKNYADFYGISTYENGFDFFCSTLSISPHKNAEYINSVGFALENGKAKWLQNDFKKENGFLRSTQLCRELDIYRQSYCGCKFE